MSTDVGRGDGEQVERGSAVTGLPDDAHVVLGVHDHRQASAHQLLVVDEHHSDRGVGPDRVGPEPGRA